MADSKLSALTPRGTPDRAVDQIYVINGTSEYRSTLNNELGITGTPVGTSDIQTLTNKTLTAPTISSPVLSGTVTGTYTLGGTPTFPSTVTTLTGVQTLTNKTLTSPTLNTPTLTNASITQDSVVGFTTANTGTVYGVGITAGVLSTNNSVPNNTLSNTGSFGAAWAFTSWSPTWTNLTINNGTQVAKYSQMGKRIQFYLSLTVGSTTAFTATTPTFTLPVASIAAYAPVAFMPIGIAGFNDVSAGATVTLGNVTWNSTTTGSITVTSAGGTYDTASGITSAVPFTFATGDTILLSGIYEAA
jgi:hypothetical protein